MTRKKVEKRQGPLYAFVCLMEGRRVYTGFGKDLPDMIRQAEGKPGVIAIEMAHSTRPPVWVRDAKTGKA